MVHRRVRGADSAANAGLAGDRARRFDAHPCAHRQRKDARRLSLLPRSTHVHAPNRRKPAAAECCTCRRSRHWRWTSSGTCARRSPVSRRSPGGAARNMSPRRSPSGPGTRRERARPFPARAGRHPDHDSRIAVSAVDVQRARGAAVHRHDHHRRDSRAGADQARRASRAVHRNALLDVLQRLELLLVAVVERLAGSSARSSSFDTFALMTVDIRPAIPAIAASSKDWVRVISSTRASRSAGLTAGLGFRGER